MVIMGVSGCGKSSVGRALALTDADRAGWLAAPAAELVQRRRAGRAMVLACSALRHRYRERLREPGPRRFDAGAPLPHILSAVRAWLPATSSPNPTT